MKVLSVFGTRPEVIKLAPVIHRLQQSPGVEHVLCSTGQHRRMLDQVTSTFDLKPDVELNVMRPDQDITHITTAVLDGVSEVIRATTPDWVVVQGDTTTCFAAALAAFYQKTRVAHVEAGLRTGNLASPWPEECNRRLVSILADLHFAPTDIASTNLRAEGISPDRIVVTGNTVIDALLFALGKIKTSPALLAEFRSSFDFLDEGRRLILVTGHRRENLGSRMEDVCQALSDLAARPDVQIVFPVHLNPQVQTTVRRALLDKSNVKLLDPLEYLPFVYLMERAYLIISDSGGIQEEAPALGKPVLVTRDTTERPEAVAAGTAKLVGTSSADIVREANKLLDDAEAYDLMARARNPFGDGHAAERIVSRLTAVDPRS